MDTILKKKKKLLCIFHFCHLSQYCPFQHPLLLPPTLGHALHLVRLFLYFSVILEELFTIFCLFMTLAYLENMGQLIQSQFLNLGSWDRVFSRFDSVMPVWLENYKRAMRSLSGLHLRPHGVHLPLIDGLNFGHPVSKSVSPLYRCWYAPCKNELSGGDT